MTVDEFIRRLMVLYGTPDSPDDAAFLEEYREMLNGTGEHLLKPAGDIIRDTHSRRGWPTPAEVKTVVSKAAALAAPRKYETKRDDESDAPSNGRRRMPDEEREALMRAFRASMAEFELKNIVKRERPDVTRPAFEAMQRNSPNGFHRKIT